MNKQLIGVIAIIALVIGFIFWNKSKSESDLVKIMDVPSFEMTNQYGEKFTERDMLGKVYLVEFFFTSCPTICPVMKQNLRIIEDSINDPQFGIVSITIDPKRDTPERLLQHYKQIQAKSPNWYMLTAERDYIQEVSKKFNIYLGDAKDDAKSLDHSGQFALVDKQGKIRSRVNGHGIPKLYYSGLNYTDAAGVNPSLNGTYHPDVTMVIEDIKKLLEE
ncbi:SCO family protein [Faecalibacter macacae]|uniref:SCO family protein n=1 Tax=Faecalibacter macacae TaxID=1859289 RepID=A0A3L9MJD7_9FLAO|nr:SCO family protein [Faecalibacter macacae]RLZ12286.1 SCO family protein [Faecalibacter macacae]